MPTVELERTLVKSPPELWDEISSDSGLSRWLGEVHVRTDDPQRRLEWDGGGASGVIELEASGWGTKIRASIEGNDDLERRLNELLDDLGSSSLTGSN